MKVIINADDFGLNSSVTDAILESFTKGYISNTTMMVNMPDADRAVELAKKNNVWDRVGLHINLFEGKPLNPDLNECKFMFNGGGMTYWAKGIRRIYLPLKTRREIFKEIDFQMQKFISYDPKCMHVDSHGHLHTNLSVWFIFKQLMKKYGFESTRLARNLYIPSNRGLKERFKKLYNNDVQKNFQFSTTYFGSFRDLAAYIGDKDFSESFMEDDIIELMCHAIYNQEKLENAGSINFDEIQKLIKGSTLDKF